MPVTVQEQREIRQVERQLAAQGVEGSLSFNRLNEKRQWYRADGTPLPTLLPADEYHVRLYMEKGWTLVPPQNGGRVRPPSGPSLIEQELERNRLAAEKKAAKGQKLSPIEAEVQRETANKQEDDLRRQAVVTEGTSAENTATTFLSTVKPPETESAQSEGPVLPCPEEGCGYVAQGKSERLRKARLQNHTYGPRSKHKKEKQDG